MTTVPFSLDWNPLRRVRHNNFRLFGTDELPRFVFHLAHVALGLPGAVLVALHVGPYSVAALLTLGLSLLAKHAWIIWRGLRIPGVHFSVYHPAHWPDLISDVLLAQLGCVLGLIVAAQMVDALAGWVVAFYVLGTFNGT